MLYIPVLIVVAALCNSLVLIDGAAREWYYECIDGNCGYNNNHHLASTANCRDEDQQCVQYARMGECFANPKWMHLHCPRSCGVCDDDEKEEGEPSGDDTMCTDKHSSCLKWAEEMECVLNPAYMSAACPASCGLCLNLKGLRDEGISETEIRRRKLYAETDFGLWQTIPTDEQEDVVRQRVHKMGEYMKQLQSRDNIGRKSVCNNQFHECAYWAVTADEMSDCQGNIHYMISHCSLACEYCHVVEQYHTCRQSKLKEGMVPFHDTPAVRSHLMSNYPGAINLLEGECSAAKAENVDEWIVSLNSTSFWSTDESTKQDSSEISQMELLNFLQSDRVNWSDPARWKDTAAVTFDGDNSSDRSGMFLPASKSLASEPTFNSFVSRMSTVLNVPQQNLEVEFVRYQRGERFAPHLDFRVHDSWKNSGVRVISAYVVVQRAQEGGNYGFPSLEWTLVEEPQILVWPNVAVNKTSMSGSLKPLKSMENEQLPVVEGVLYAAHAWVHEYPYNPSSGTCA